MTEKSDTDKLFIIENCRAEESAGGLVRCLLPEQGRNCKFSLPFGDGYFCKHLQRKEFIVVQKNNTSDNE